MSQLPDQITLLKLFTIQPTIHPTHVHVKEQSTQMFQTFNWLGTDKTEKYIIFCKIAKILCALWVAEMCVCMQVCWHSWIKQGKTLIYSRHASRGEGEAFSKVDTQPGLGTPCKPSKVCIAVLNSPNHSCVYIRLCKHRKNLWTKLFSHIFCKRKHLS